MDPDILVFDEPSAGLDPIVSAELDGLILFLKQAFHMTILVVTHEISSAFRIADRIAMLYKGSLIAVEDRESFKASTHPRIRQFLDRVPDMPVETPVVQERLRELSGTTGATT
jgi:phospholipid/cholesterol/gamma-HCH transport system ATP-binding protein